MLNKIVLGEAEHSPAGFLSCLERLVDINCKDMSIDFYIENIEIRVKKSEMFGRKNSKN